MTGTADALTYYPGRAVFTALFVTVVGPLIGGALILIGLWLASETPADGIPTSWENLLQIASFVGVYSYILGIVQTAAAGIVMAFYVFFRGRVSSLIAILGSLFGTLVFAAIYTIVIDRDVPADSPTAFIADSNVLGLVIFLGILGIGAGLICRALLGAILPQAPVAVPSPADRAQVA